MTERHSVLVLNEAAAIQRSKSIDYQNVNSRIEQTDYYPRGCDTILDMIHSKILRMYSVSDAQKAGGKENFESLRDSALDAINYLSFYVSYMDGKMEGQNPLRDMNNNLIIGADVPTTIHKPADIEVQVLSEALPTWSRGATYTPVDITYPYIPTIEGEAI